jgi:HSP20 family protein
MAVYPTRYSDPFDQIFNSVFGTNGGRTNGHSTLMRAPETDVVETEKEIRVVAEMPGLKRDNIEIDVENNILTIRGEKREERTEGEQGRWHLAERRYGTFSRSFVLPRDVDAENIQASFQDGVLTVSVPKSEKARRRRIEIGAMGGQQQLGSEEQQTVGAGADGSQG